MTPKEKAVELVDKFQGGYKNYEGFNYQFNLDESDAIHCALIAVDEILTLFTNDKWDSRNEFYQEVKQEIEKL